MAYLVKNHPALSLFLLSFLLGSLPIILVAMQLLPVGCTQLGALSASVAGVILAGIEGGRGSVGELLRRGLVWRVNFGWWFLSLLYIVPLVISALYFGTLINGSSLSLDILPPVYTALPTIVVLIVLAGLGEEYGWRGFLLPRLQRDHNAVVSSLIVGLFHSLWHIPLFLVEGTAQSDWAAEVGLIPAFIGYSTFVVAWAVQLTWFFNNTRGSVLVVAVVHGAGNAWIGGYFDISGNAGIVGNVVLAFLMVAFSLALVAIVGGTHLSRRFVRDKLH